MDRRAKVWRYLNWTKFLDLIRTQSLWFARCDQFTDPAEGSWTKADAEMFQTAWEAMKEQSRMRQMLLAKRSWKDFHDTTRLGSFISCWQMKPTDSMPMWDQYCGKQKQIGVAIQSTYERLDAGVPFAVGPYQSVMLGCIRYGDFESPTFRTEANGFAKLMVKKQQYADESEVRMIIFRPSQPNMLGFHVPVNLRTIVERVVLSPYSAAPVLQAARRLCESIGVESPVVRSTARDVVHVF